MSTPQEAVGQLLQEVIVERSGSVRAYAQEFSVDRANLYRYLRGGRDIPTTVLLTHLLNVGYDPDVFMRQLRERLLEAATPTQPE